MPGIITFALIEKNKYNKSQNYCLLRSLSLVSLVLGLIKESRMTALVEIEIHRVQPLIVPFDFEHLQKLLQNALKSRPGAQQEKEILDLIGTLTTQNDKDAKKLTELAILLITAGIPGENHCYHSDTFFCVRIWEKERSLLLKALQLQADNPDALVYLAQILTRYDLTKGDIREELQQLPLGIGRADSVDQIKSILLKRALELDSTHTLVRILSAEIELSDARDRNIRNSAAVDRLRHILASDPDNIIALRVLGGHLVSQNLPALHAKGYLERGEEFSVPPTGIVAIFDVAVDFALNHLPREKLDEQVGLGKEGEAMRQRSIALLNAICPHQRN